MNFNSIFITILGVSAISCSSQKEYGKLHHKSIDDRKHSMEILYSKLGTSNDQKEELRVLDRELVTHYLGDLKKIGRNQTLIKERKDKMKLATDIAFTKVLTTDQLEVYNLFTQSQNQSFFTMSTRQSEYLVNK